MSMTMKMKKLFSFLLIAGLVPEVSHGADATMPVPAPSRTLTLAAARELALTTHPRITVVQLRALIAQEVVTETRAGFYPTLAINATKVEVGENITRLSSGNLSNSQIYDHSGIGATLSLLVTDFGRTANLSNAAKQRAKAAESDVLATRAQLLLEVDAVYFGALKAQAVKEVAAKTLSGRQTLFDRARVMSKNQLKSELDVRFAQVAVDEAKLLEDEADKDWQTAIATLQNLIGEQAVAADAKLELPPVVEDLPGDIGPLTDLALKQRPELTRQRAEGQAAKSMALAARDARLPTVSLLAAGGYVPTNDPHFERKYAVAGVNLNLPLFAGGLYRARQREAELASNASDAVLKDQQNAAMRDVKLAWLEAGSAHRRIALTASLLDSATAALTLAQSRFDQGISSIVELNQAELAQTSAGIAHATADYSYRVRRDMLDYATGSLR